MFLMMDVGKLSPLHKTYCLELFQTVVNTFALKSTHFFYSAMLARLLAENSNGVKFSVFYFMHLKYNQFLDNIFFFRMSVDSSKIQRK